MHPPLARRCRRLSPLAVQPQGLALRVADMPLSADVAPSSSTAVVALFSGFPRRGSPLADVTLLSVVATSSYRADATFFNVLPGAVVVLTFVGATLGVS